MCRFCCHYLVPIFSFFDAVGRVCFVIGLPHLYFCKQEYTLENKTNTLLFDCHSHKIKLIQPQKCAFLKRNLCQRYIENVIDAVENVTKPFYRIFCAKNILGLPQTTKNHKNRLPCTVEEKTNKCVARAPNQTLPCLWSMHILAQQAHILGNIFSFLTLRNIT